MIAMVAKKAAVADVGDIGSDNQIEKVRGKLAEGPAKTRRSKRKRANRMPRS